MPENTWIRHTSWISEASAKLGIDLRRHTEGQAVGSHPNCPVPGKNQDRFVVFEEGNYWCRQCGEKGFWLDKPPSPEEVEARKKERQSSQATLYKRMHRNQDWLQYCRDTRAMDAWVAQGMTPEDIQTWGLGFCESCPCAPQHPSLTIPIFFKKQLWDIRHRLIDVQDTAKYRSHLPGLTPPFFNLDCLLGSAPPKQVYIVEGEKKVITCGHTGLLAVIGVPGMQFYHRLPKVVNRHLHPYQEVIFVPDPGTLAQVTAIAEEFVCERRFVVELWVKPDDFIREEGIEAFQKALLYRRPL